MFYRFVITPSGHILTLVEMKIVFLFRETRSEPGYPGQCGG